MITKARKKALIALARFEEKKSLTGEATEKTEKNFTSVSSVAFCSEFLLFTQSEGNRGNCTIRGYLKSR